MKTIPNYNFKIEIDDAFIKAARIELNIFKSKSFISKIKYDFKNLPILNYLDKSFYKYIFNMEEEINADYASIWLPVQLHPDYNIDDDKKHYFNLIAKNIIKNLIKDKQYEIIINNIGLLDKNSFSDIILKKHLTC